MVIPRGVFLTGAVHLDNNVNLYLSPGATLLFSTDTHDYLPNVFTRFESTECMNYSALIYAFEQTNIAVTGSGTLATLYAKAYVSASLTTVAPPCFSTSRS